MHSSHYVVVDTESECASLQVISKEIIVLPHFRFIFLNVVILRILRIHDRDVL